MMEFKEFRKLAQSYNTVPVYKKVLSDLLTPVSAYLRLTKDSPYSVLLESVEEGRQLARYSYIGRDPVIRLVHDSGKTTITTNGTSEISERPFFDILREMTGRYKAPGVHDIPLFSGGWIGYTGYETIQWVEDIPVYPVTEEDVPDAVFLFFDTLIAFDHVKRETIISRNVIIDDRATLKDQYQHALEEIETIQTDLHTDHWVESSPAKRNDDIVSNFTMDQFCRAVKKANEYIRAGDAFQLVLSQRFQRSTEAEPFTVYRALRSVNPSPFMFFLNMDGFQLIGASPEVLVKVENREMQVRPIAGTRRRGNSVDEDNALAEDLLADEKECAEHLMLVDLARNDVGRVCQYGSIDIRSFMTIERYSHVMHIVSDVRGQLMDQYDAFDALMAGFPAGTVTGAPKIRAMEIIHELEPTRRGIYSGAVGYLDLHGNLTTCITIRTLLMKNQQIFFQSGAGIVYDSVPEKEYEETKNKAEAIMKAIDFAERGLQ